MASSTAIKPENLLLDKSGQVFLVDFGIAKSLTATSTLTTMGARALSSVFLLPNNTPAPAAPMNAVRSHALGARYIFC